MAGLLAAAAVAGSGGSVTVLERDPLVAEPALRRGTPHARHLHALLARGAQVLEEFFPGLLAELVAQGGRLGDIQQDVRWVNDGHRMARAPSGLVGLGVSRALLEARVRARVRELPGVNLVDCADVEEPVLARGRVMGVRYRRHDGRYTAAADLTIDATGRGSRSPAWLQAWGYRPPPQEEVAIDLVYTTRCYRFAEHHLGGDRAVFIGPTLARPRIGALMSVEGDRWIVNLGGYTGDHPPVDAAGFLAFADGLPAPDIAAVLRQAEALDQPTRHRVPTARRLRYERLTRFPLGYLVTGDALCSFNPVYGQGMTVAALEARALGDCLAGPADDLASRFFRAAARTLDVPWTVATGGDLRLPQVPGRRRVPTRLANAYLPQVHAAASGDPAVGRAFLRVANMVDRPERLLSPAVAVRVARRALHHRPPDR